VIGWIRARRDRIHGGIGAAIESAPERLPGPQPTEALLLGLARKFQ
jgi:hypothetical protein